MSDGSGPMASVTWCLGVAVSYRKHSLMLSNRLVVPGIIHTTGRICCIPVTWYDTSCNTWEVGYEFGRIFGLFSGTDKRAVQATTSTRSARPTHQVRLDVVARSELHSSLLLVYRCTAVVRNHDPSLLLRRTLVRLLLPHWLTIMPPVNTSSVIFAQKGFGFIEKSAKMTSTFENFSKQQSVKAQSRGKNSKISINQNGQS